MIHDPLCIWSSPTCSNERMHTEYPDGTNGFRDQRCRECDEYCLCELIAAVRVRTAEDIIGMLSMNTLVSLTIHGEDRKFMNSMIRSAARTK